MWRSIFESARDEFDAGNHAESVAQLNSIELPSLPKMADLHRLPYHVISEFLCRLPRIEGRWLINDVSPALLKWLANQNSNTCGGVPYIARHIGKFYESDPERLEAFRTAMERAIDLFSFDGSVTTAEAVVICQSVKTTPEKRIHDILDKVFGDFNYDQVSHVFAFWNAACVHWFKRRKTTLSTKYSDAKTLFHITTLAAAYSDEWSTDASITARHIVDWNETGVSDIRMQIQVGRAAHPKVTTASNGKLKVALCVSGQLRGYKTAFPTWEILGLHDCEVKTFVSTWHLIGRKVPHAHHAQRSFPQALAKAFADYMVQVGEEVFWRRYPTLLHLFEDAAIVTEREVTEFYGACSTVIEDEARLSVNFQSNTERLHYKIDSCHQLMSAANEIFDLIIRIRPDKVLSGPQRLDLRAVHSECLKYGVIYADDSGFFLPAGGLGIGDQVAIGTRAAMDTYASVWRNYTERQTTGVWEYGQKSELFPHTALGRECLLSGSLVRSLRRAFDIIGEPIDAEPISLLAIKEAIEADFPISPNHMDDLLIDGLKQSQR